MAVACRNVVYCCIKGLINGFDLISLLGPSNQIWNEFWWILFFLLCLFNILIWLAAHSFAMPATLFTYIFNDLSFCPSMQKHLKNNRQTTGGEYLMSHHTRNTSMWIQTLSWTDCLVPCIPTLEIFSAKLMPTLICEFWCLFPFSSSFFFPLHFSSTK